MNLDPAAETRELRLARNPYSTKLFSSVCCMNYNTCTVHYIVLMYLYLKNKCMDLQVNNTGSACSFFPHSLKEINKNNTPTNEAKGESIPHKPAPPYRALISPLHVFTNSKPDHFSCSLWACFHQQGACWRLCFIAASHEDRWVTFSMGQGPHAGTAGYKVTEIPAGCPVRSNLANSSSLSLFHHHCWDEYCISRYV